MKRMVRLAGVPCLLQGEDAFVTAIAAEHGGSRAEPPVETAPVVITGRVQPGAVAPPVGAVLEDRAGGVDRYRHRDDVWFVSAQSAWQLSRSEGRWLASGVGVSAGSLLEIGRAILEACVSTVCEEQGLLPVHAAAVSLRGAGILICGHSGFGKSTLALQLCSDHGAAMVADDTCFFDPATGRLVGYLPHVATYVDGPDPEAYTYSTGVRRRLVAPGALGVQVRGGEEHALSLLIQPVWGLRSSVRLLDRPLVRRVLAPLVAEGVKPFFQFPSEPPDRVLKRRLMALERLMRRPAFLFQTGRDPAEVAVRVAGLLAQPSVRSEWGNANG